MADDQQNLVERWFGDGFSQLHPLLQTLHRQGGSLSGPIRVSLGRGLGGLLGRRLAQRLGIPWQTRVHHLAVNIFADAVGLRWNRSFDAEGEFRSTFVPVGHWPEGYWLEQSGALQLRLRVNLRAGAWHWQTIAARWRGVPLPLWLLPHTLAYKEVRGGQYHFHVSLSLPLLGLLLSYAGDLQAHPVSHQDLEFKALRES